MRSKIIKIITLTGLLGAAGLIAYRSYQIGKMVRDAKVLEMKANELEKKIDNFYAHSVSNLYLLK